MLTSQSAIDLFMTRAEELGYSVANGGAMVAESARWGDSKSGMPLTKTDWLQAVNNEINNFFPTRAAVLLDQLQRTVLPTWRGSTPAPLYPDVNAPDFNQYGGAFAPGFALTMTGTGTIYYSLDGTDPRLPGGAVRAGALVYTHPVTLNTATHVLARGYDHGTWSALSEVVFYVDLSSSMRVTELMYHPAASTAGETAQGYTSAGFEFIELNNIGPQAVPLGGLQFVDGVAFTFPEQRPGTSQQLTRAPSGYAVVVANEAAFRWRYPDFAGLLAGQYSGRLDDAGETVELAGPDGAVIQAFTYRDGWYGLTDGAGFSLTIRDPRQDRTQGDTSAGWRASAAPGGTPGSGDSLAAPGAVVIHEVLAHSDEAYGDAIELYNTTERTIDVSGWFVSDDAAELRKYQIGAGTVLLPGGYLVLTQGDNFGLGASDPGSRIGFGFSEYGDAAYLSSNALAGGALVAGGYREHVDFGATPAGLSVGLYTTSTGSSDFTLLATPTLGPRQGHTFLGAANSAPYQSPLVLNEIMYHPADPTAAEQAAGYRTSDFEYLELYNRSGQTQTLAQFTVTGGIGFTFGWIPGDLTNGRSAAFLTQEAAATATWNATGLGASNTYHVYATYPLFDPRGQPRNLDEVAAYTITYQGGTTTVAIDQDDTHLRQLDGDSTLWVDLGSYTFNGTGKVVLARSSDSQQDDMTIAGNIVFRRTGQSDKVFDKPALDSPWRQAGITTIAPGGYVILTSNRAAFDARYHLAANQIPWAGSYSGHLSDSGERIDLNAAATSDADAFTGQIPIYRLERVDYGDGLPNWPIEADGAGVALHRTLPDQYASDPRHWQASGVPGTPGRANSLVIDRTPPSVPAGLSAVPAVSPLKISLRWRAAVDAESAVDHYVIYRDGLPVATTAETSYADTAIAGTLNYSYRVSAVNRDGFGSLPSVPQTVGFPCVVSGSVTAGRRYYVEALQKEGGGGDHLAVRWQLPGGIWENPADPGAPIPGIRLVPFGGVPDLSPPSTPSGLGATTLSSTAILLAWNPAEDPVNGQPISGTYLAPYVAPLATLPVSLSVQRLSTSDRTPPLGGQISDPSLAVSVGVAGRYYPATNQGDGTWALPDNALDVALSPGVYDVCVRTVDSAGRMAFDSSQAELVIVLHPWQNLILPVDVNADSNVSPLDVLLVINQINADGTGLLPVPPFSALAPPYVDVSGDDQLTPSDVLVVINFINSRTVATGEGEAVLTAGLEAWAASDTVAVDANMSTGSGSMIAANPEAPIAVGPRLAPQRLTDGAGPQFECAKQKSIGEETLGGEWVDFDGLLDLVARDVVASQDLA